MTEERLMPEKTVRGNGKMPRKQPETVVFTLVLILLLFLPAPLPANPMEAESGAAAWMVQGNRQYREGAWEESVASWERARRLYARQGDARGLRKVLRSLGLGYARLGNNQTALSCLEESLGTARTVRDRTGEAMALTDLGRLYRRLGYYALSLPLFREALTVQRALGDSIKIGDLHSELGASLDYLGDYERAVEQGLGSTIEFAPASDALTGR